MIPKPSDSPYFRKSVSSKNDSSQKADVSSGLQRVRTKPKPTDWERDDLMSLFEAAAVFWPDGPITVASLRTAVRAGQLQIAKIGKRFFTTRRAIEAMIEKEVRYRR